MPRFILAVLALFVLLAAILVVAPGLVPVSAYKGRLEAAASEALGREVTIGDELSLKIVPRTAFRVTDLTIANAAGFEGPHLARVKAADIGVRLIPLFSGAVNVERFVLTEPEINLAVDADGSVNWNLAKSEAPAAEDEGSDVRELSLGDVRIVDGRATYADAAAGRTYTIDDIDASVRLASLAEPLEVEGAMIFEGAPSRIDLVLTSLRAILENAPANLKFDMTLGEATAGADLVVESGETFSYTGPVRLAAPDLPAFAALMGAPLAEAPGFDALSVEGEAAGGPNGVRLTGATIVFDKIDATGDLALAWGGARPKATGRLAVGALDLRPYLPPPAAEGATFPAWSAEPLDLASLRNIDAEIDVAADQIFLNDMEFGESRMKLTIDNGRMVADIPELGLYGGGGSGRLVVNAREATPSFTGAFDLGAVQAEPFAKDVMKNDRLLGVGNFKLEFNAAGASQAEIMRSVDGSGGFDLADGALKGVNIAKLARAIGELRQSGLNPTAISAAIAAAQQTNEETDFSEFLSAFQITDGLVNAPEISLVGPFLAMAGTGSVNLPAQTLDLRLVPKAMTTIDGEGGQAYTIPMRVTGTFANPQIAIDVESLLRGRVEQGLQNVLDGLTRPRAEGEEGEEPASPARSFLEGVLGRTPDAEPAGPAPSGEPPPAAEPDGDGQTASEAAPKLEETLANEALNRLFGRPKKPTPPAAETAEEPASEDPPP